MGGCWLKRRQLALVAERGVSPRWKQPVTGRIHVGPLNVEGDPAERLASPRVGCSHPASASPYGPQIQLREPFRPVG
jgi:hypothetical protein